MACEVTEEKLWSWLDRADPQLNAHLAACPLCRTRARDLRTTIDAVADAGPKATSPLPETIGPYEIIGVLGEGAQGIVFEARQKTPARHVALKVIKGGRHVVPEDIRLFEREIHTLALLKHPSIAAIYDAGTTDDGHHFFAMELVHGEPLTEYVEGRKLPLQARVGLLRDICTAIHYAHQRGVIHRDLKPGHVLIEADGRPKVLDFGLARVIDPAQNEPIAATRVGRVQGTVPYMSPEQIRGRTDDVDVRTDVYALGVLIYQTLTQRLPYDVTGLDALEAGNVICGSTPVRPSTVDRHLRGEIETIVLKALEKEPSRRYQSALALADDLERFQTGQAIQARPASLLYQFRKLVLRHRLATGLAAAVLGLLVLTAVVTTVAYRNQREEAEKTQRLADSLEYILTLFNPEGATGPVDLYQILADASERIEEDRDIYPDVEAKTHAVIGNAYLGLGRYDMAARELWRALGLQQGLHPTTDHVDLAAVQQDLAAALFAKGDLPVAARLFQDTLEMRRRLLGSEHKDVAETLNGFAMLLQAQGETARAEALYREALDVNRTLFGPEHPAVASTLHNLATLLRDRGDLASAEALFLEALDMRRRLLHERSTHVAATLDELAKLRQMRGDMRQAEKDFTAALEMRRALLTESHPQVALSLDNLARLYADRGDLRPAIRGFRAAMELRRQLLGADHRLTLESMEGLADVLARAGFNEASAAMYLQVADTLRGHLETRDGRSRVQSERNSGMVRVLNAAARQWLGLDRPEDAAPLLAEALTLRRRDQRVTEAELGTATLALGRCLLNAGRIAEAEPLLRESIERLSGSPGSQAEEAVAAFEQFCARCDAAGDLRSVVTARLITAAEGFVDSADYAAASLLFGRAVERVRTGAATERWRLSGLLRAWGEILAALRDDESALLVYRELLSLDRAQYGDDAPVALDTMTAIASALRNLNRPVEAATVLESVLTARRAAAQPDAAATAAVLLQLAQIQLDRGLVREAELLARECVSIRSQVLPADHWLTANARSVLGGCLLEQRAFAEAEPMLVESRAVLTAQLSAEHGLSIDATERLVRLYDRWGRPELADVYRQKLARAETGGAGS